jgi:protein-S-isoprenylcysteine O-methyltransferase Ste14
VRFVFASALVITFWDFFWVQGMIFNPSFVSVVGLCLLVSGSSVRLVAVRTLGRYFSTELKTLQDHRLIKHGVYKYVRHPAYLGSSMLAIGITLIFSSFWGFLLMLALLLCYLYRINREEKMLLEKLGDEYRDYMRSTKKILPFLY